MTNDRLATQAEHERWMKRCIELAIIAQSRDCTPVGSIVVLHDEIVGEGIESLPAGSSLTGHAEILACQMAVERTGNLMLNGATLYTTAEPCFMCSYVIRQCAIPLVVYGIETPVIGGITSRHPILTDDGLANWTKPPRVLGGILRDDCLQLKNIERE